MISKKRVCLATVLGLIFILGAFLPEQRQHFFAAADGVDGFDTQFPGAPQAPWSLAVTNSTCLNGAITQTVQAYTTPNVFEYTENLQGYPACYAPSQQQTYKATLWVELNASASLVHVSFEENLFSLSVACGTIQSQFTVYWDQLSQYSVNPTQGATCPLAKATWYGVSNITIITTPGTTHLLNFTYTATSNNNQGFATFAIDSVVVNGANFVVKNYNYVMMGFATNQWFNVSAYTPSSLLINYSQATSCPYPLAQSGPNACSLTSLTTPDQIIPLTTANLITAYIGSYRGSATFYRTIIPQGTYIVQLFDPGASVLPYIITVNDLTGLFGPGTQIYLSEGNTMVVSGYLDAQQQFGCYLVPGSYNMKLINGVNQYSTTINAASSGSITLTIDNVNVKPQVGPNSYRSFGAAWNSTLTGIIASYSDTEQATSQVVINLLLQNMSGTYTVATQTLTGTIGSVVTTFPANINNTNGYTVNFIATTSQGTIVLGPVAVSGGRIFPSSPSLPPDMFGMNVFFPQANAWVTLLGFSLIVFTASIFGAKASPLGLVAITLESLLFWAAGWLLLPYDLMAGILALGVLGFMLFRARRQAYQ